MDFAFVHILQDERYLQRVVRPKLAFTNRRLPGEVILVDRRFSLRRFAIRFGVDVSAESGVGSDDLVDLDVALAGAALLVNRDEVVHGGIVGATRRLLHALVQIGIVNRIERRSGEEVDFLFDAFRSGAERWPILPARRDRKDRGAASCHPPRGRSSSPDL